MKTYMKTAAFLLLIVCTALCISPAVRAVDWDEYGVGLGTEDVERAIPDSASGLMDGVDISVGENYTEAAERIFKKALDSLGGILRSAARSAALILMAATLCSIASAVYSPAEGGFDYVQLAGVLAVAVISAGDIKSCVGLGKSTILELSDFSRVLLPCLTSTAAVSGAVTSAAAKYAASALFMDILLTGVEAVVIPLIYAYMAVLIAECAIGGQTLSGVASFLKWMATGALTLLVLAFVIYLSISGIVSGSADAATVRVAKTALSTTLPVVGGIISDAANTVLVGASLLKSSVGVFGLLTVLAVCLVPVLKLGGHYLMYKLASRLSEAISGGRTAKVAGGIGGAFGIIMGATGACAMMLFFSILSFVQAVI